MNPIAFIIWIFVFALAFAIVTWLVNSQPARNIFYAVLAVVALLMLVGLLSSPYVVRFH